MNTWYGITEEGSLVSIRHSLVVESVARIKKRDRNFVSLGDIPYVKSIVTQDNARYVRGRDKVEMIEEAQYMGWNDLVEALEEEMVDDSIN